MEIKKDRAIVFTVSNDLAFAIACVMFDIKRLSPNLADEIVIIHDGISEKDKKLLGSILPTRFIIYDFPIKDTSIFNQGTLNYFTKMVFAKFECLKLLDEYNTVMLSDYDIVIQSDISELFEKCESGIKFMRTESHTVLQQCHSPIKEYDMTRQGISAGIFILQSHIGDYLRMYEFCYEKLEKYADQLHFPEQAIFDLMTQEFNLEIFKIDHKIYSPHPTDIELSNKAKIIHAYGQPKFWNGLENDTWNKNYSAWLDMGGTKFKKTFAFNRALSRLKNYWKKRVIK